MIDDPRDVVEALARESERFGRVPWDDLDPGIRPVVRSAVAAGFDTIGSCQGHGSGDAWVDIEIPRDVVDVWGYASRVKAWVYAEGWDRACIVSARELLDRDIVPFRSIRVEWWGGVQLR